jgi:phosphatidylserine/phosphatidylglycerophosphate/cardiolipin synthase-like enzyme
MRPLPASTLCALLLASCVRADRRAAPDSDRNCGESAVFAMLNDLDTSVTDLTDLGIRSNAARNIVDARDGGTIFDDMDDVDAIKYVGPVTIDLLEEYGDSHCDAPACSEPAILSLVNAPSTGADDLRGIGVYSRGADNIVAWRDGGDGLPGTGDDAPFERLEDIDRVPYVGDSSVRALEDWGEQRCALQVVFSPQHYSDSHLIATEDAINSAAQRIDVAMYSFSDGTMHDALEDAVKRGVSVRVLYHGAATDRSDTEGSRSARLEDMGIEVRWVNKIMHHKYAIIDGPRASAADAAGATLVSGSANWSYSAATRYDENTLLIRGDERLVLLYQQEFDLLWDNSRPLVWNEDIQPVGHVGITDEDIAAAEGSDALFTSANMRTYVSSRYGPTFARDGSEWAVAEAIADMIRSAESSVWIASGHMRARPVYEAILDVGEDVDLRVYLDGQEYTSASYYGSQVDAYEDCLDDGESGCDDKGLHFGTGLHQAGVPLRYKYYAYRWDYRYAEQMHHKYIVIDGQTLVTGSYNLSPNAEFDTMENVTILSASDYPSVVSDFVDNFRAIWDTRRDGSYDSLVAELEDGEGDIPLVFPAMALDWDQIDALKSAIKAACPDVSSDDYREDPENHTACPRP